MPVYHFTFHAYGTWLPDRSEGYDPHDQGHKPPDPAEAERYRDRMRQPATTLCGAVQRHALQILIDSQSLQHFELYAFATEPTHLHALIGWRDNRDPVKVRSQVKSSLTRALNRAFEKRQWFVAKGGHTVVTDQEHLCHLADHYLPKHQGLFWKRQPPDRQSGNRRATPGGDS